MFHISPNAHPIGLWACVIPNCIWVTCLPSWTASIVDHGIGSGSYADGMVNMSIRFGAHATEPFAPLYAWSTTGILPLFRYPVLRETGILYFSSLYPYDRARESVPSG